MMGTSQATGIPEVYVLWHPDCALGEPLAKRILGWLRPGNGLGPDVFYRCLPAPDAPPKGLPLPLTDEYRLASTSVRPTAFKGKICNQQIVLPLVDEHMVADQTWRHWLTQLAGGRSCVMMPVALDPTAYNLPAGLRGLNFLRPTGLPLADGWKADGPEFDAVARSLLRQVTEAMCRLLLPRPVGGSGDMLPKVNVFLSHAKQDGAHAARRLRDYIYSQTQLAAFFDENDIAFGSVFSKVILSDLDSPDTAALIAVRSARYFSRPWCRREFASFRKPRPEAAAVSGAQRWRLYPALVVEAIEGRELSYGIPETGNCPMIRWNEEDKTLEELVVTTIIRDALLASFHSAVGAMVPSQSGEIIINWLPDPTTLLHIPALRLPGEHTILYPGRGLAGLELDVLDEFFPNVTFRSFEEVLS
jgi:hypothetical protein